MSGDRFTDYEDEPGDQPTERIQRWLDDLRQFANDCRHIVGHGREAFTADSADGRLLRYAAQRLLINVATIVERLPEGFKAGYPQVEWVSIARMRNLVAHHYDKVNDDLIWQTLLVDIPRLAETIAPDPGRG